MKPQKFSILDILTGSPSLPKHRDSLAVLKSEKENESKCIASLPTPPHSPMAEKCFEKQSADSPIKETPKRDTAGVKRKRDPIGQILDSLCTSAEKKAGLGPSAFSPIITSSCPSQLSPISLLAQCDRRCLQMSPNMLCSPFTQSAVRPDMISPMHPPIEQMQFIHAQKLAQQQQQQQQHQHQQQQLHQQQISLNPGLYPYMIPNGDVPPTLQQIQMFRQQQAQLMAMENYNSNILANRNSAIGNSVPANTTSPYWMAWLKTSGGEALSSLPLKESRIPPPPPRYQCDACKKSYSTFGGLSKHKQFHCVSHIKKEFNCKYCDKSYGSLGALKMHIRTHTLPCKCKLCGKAFSRPWLLQGHVRTHTGEKPFKCAHCGRSFADRSNLRAHLQTHSDIKKYGCKNCTKTFSRMSLLLKHEEGSCLGLRR